MTILLVIYVYLQPASQHIHIDIKIYWTVLRMQDHGGSDITLLHYYMTRLRFWIELITITFQNVQKYYKNRSREVSKN